MEKIIFYENNQKRNSSCSQDENAIIPARERYKKSQKLKEYSRSQNDSIPELSHHYYNNAYFDNVENNESEPDSDNVIRRKNNRFSISNSSHQLNKREAIKFDEEYLEKNLLLQEFLLNSNKSITTNKKSKTYFNNDDSNYGDDDDHYDIEKLSNTVISSECVYQNFCNECGYDIPNDFKGNQLCDLCQYTDVSGDIVYKRKKIPDKICMKCGILFFGRDGAELCRNCQTIRNEQLLFEQNDLEKIYVNLNNNVDYKNKIQNKKSNKNQKRFFHGIIDTLKRVKSNKKIEKPIISSNPSVNRLQIVHNIDGYDNVFHTKNTFDIKEISELKANSSQTTKDLENLHNNRSGINYDNNEQNKKISHEIESIKNHKYNIERRKNKQLNSKSDTNLNKIKRSNSSSKPLLSDSFSGYDYHRNLQNTSCYTVDISTQLNSNEKTSTTNLKKFSHSTPKQSINSVNRSDSNYSNTFVRKQIPEKVKTANDNSNYQYGNSKTSVALEKQSKYNDNTNNHKIDLSMDFSQSIKSSADSAHDYCVLFDSVIDWLRTTRYDQHIYYNFDYDDSIFCIKNIPSRTNYDNFGYNYLTATTSATITTTNSDKSHKSFLSYNTGYPNYFIDYYNYPIYDINMKKNSKIDSKISKLNKNLSEDQNLTNKKDIIISGNSKFYKDTSHSSMTEETSNQLQVENNNTKLHSIQPRNINDFIIDTSQHKLRSKNLSQVYSHYSGNSSKILSPTTKSLCLPYEFSKTKDIDSVHLHSSTEQQVISITGGSVNDNNKRIVNVNSRQEIRNQKKKEQNQQYHKLKSKENKRKSYTILNESKNLQSIDIIQQGDSDSKNITQTTVLNNSCITYSSSSGSKSVSTTSSCSGSNSSSCISELNDEYTRHMVDNFKRNLMEKQKYNEFIRQQQRSKRRAIYLKPDDETVHQLQLNYHRDNINFSDNLLLHTQQSSNSNSDINYYNCDLENNTSNSEISHLKNSNELNNAISNTIIDDISLSICENNNNNNNCNVINDTSSEFTNEFINIFEPVLKCRDLESKESVVLHNNNNNNNNVNIDINCNEIIKKELSEIESFNKNLITTATIENYKNIFSKLNSNFNYETISNTNYCQNIIETTTAISNIPLNVIISNLFPNQIIKLENIIIALNLSKSLNKITIFYDKSLSSFLNCIQNTQIYSRCKQKYLLKLFRNFQYFIFTKQTLIIDNDNNFKNKNQIKGNNEFIENNNDIEFNNNNNNNNNNNSIYLSNTKDFNNKNNLTIFINTDINKNNFKKDNNINNTNKNSEIINNQINRKKPIPPPRRFLPHMAPTLPPTPPLKPRNLSKSTTVELEQSSKITPLTNSIKVSPPIVASRGKSSINKNLSSSSPSTSSPSVTLIKSPHDNMRSQLKDDDDIYQPIWKCQTLNNNNTVEKVNNNSKADLESKYVGNNKASFNNNNESDINNKDKTFFLSSLTPYLPSGELKSKITTIDFIENSDIKDDSSATEDLSENVTINTTEEDYSQWETDDEFMFSTKINTTTKESNSITKNSNNYYCRNNTNLNDLIKTNMENDDDDYYNCGGSSSTSSGSTLTGSNCIRISKSDPELKMESYLIDNMNSNYNNNVKNNDQKSTMTNFNTTNQNQNQNNNNSNNKWKTVCIIYSPYVTKYRKILYDYNSNEINFNLNEKSFNINDNVKLLTATNKINLNNSIENNDNNNNNNNETPQLELRITAKLNNSLNSELLKNNNDNFVILRSDSFRLRTSLQRNYDNVALKRKITAMAAIASTKNINNNNKNCNNNSNESIPLAISTSKDTITTVGADDESNKYDFLYKQNFNNNYQNIILAWKETLMDINLIEDEEDMFVSEEEILKLKETVVQSEPNNFQKFKSQSTDNLHNIPDAQDKKSIRERFRNKLQRGVLKLNSRQVKDSGNKKGKETFKRLNVNSVCFEDQPKYPIFDAELQEVEMNGMCENVPRFVVDCIEIIEQKDCIQIDGLYRASGNKVAIDDLKKRITENYIFDYKMLMKNEDIHTITGLLKLFFRELKTPLIPEIFYRKLPDNLVDNLNLPLIKEILNEIPQPSLGTLKYLLKHLTTVAQYSTENRMPASNLAIVWGPCILLSDSTGPFDIGRMNTLAKILIEKYDFIFGDDERLVN